MRNRDALLLLLGLVLGGSVARADDPPARPAFDATDHYTVREVRGWRILVNRQLLAGEPNLAEEALGMIDHQLYLVERRLPAQALEKVRQVRIWLEEKEPHHQTMAYHPEEGWLREHGMNPDKAHSVEIANARSFLSASTDQPWSILHELAHAFHDQFLPEGFSNPEVLAAYRRAVDEKRYDEVLRINGHKERAYGIKDVTEYFAEQSEAFFGTNDFYPFVRCELREHDPTMYALLQRVWGTN